MNDIWEKYFPDVGQLNPVRIEFGRRAQYRLGSVRLEEKVIDARRYGLAQIGAVRKWSVITINGMFRNESIPQAVIDYTIAHELAHYAHGFSSPHRRAHKHPHKGGIVRKELERRGLSQAYASYKKWVREYRKSKIGASEQSFIIVGSS